MSRRLWRPFLLLQIPQRPVFMRVLTNLKGKRQEFLTTKTTTRGSYLLGDPPGVSQKIKQLRLTARYRKADLVASEDCV
jgi:hypothetical protein